MTPVPALSPKATLKLPVVLFGERQETNGSISVAGCVAVERLKLTVGRVVVAVSIAIERK